MFAVADLTGTVSSNTEGKMEGVVIIAQQPGESRLLAVTSDDSGSYRFPGNRLGTGTYELRIRAVGYELDTDKPFRISYQSGVDQRADLRLIKVSDVSTLAGQLTSLEWVHSFPGSTEEKDLLVRNMVNCGFCHSLERIARSGHSADDFLRVIQRMKTYETDHSAAERIQVVSHPEPLEGLQWYGRDARALAAYLASVNLSQSGKEEPAWEYQLKTLPRPSGKGTHAVVTVYPIPRQPSVIHDLDVDAKGRVWYGNTGWDYLGMLNPKTGEFSEWQAPNFSLPPAEGQFPIVGVQDIQVDPQGRIWVGVMGNKNAVFIPGIEEWKTYDLPVVWKNPFISPVRQGEDTIWATGLTAFPDGDKRHEHAFGLNVNTGQLSPGIMLFDDKATPVSPTHTNQLNYCYMMDQDADGNFLCTVPEASSIARADDKGEVRLIKTPTPFGYPRRGYRDDQNHFWFTEFFNDKLGALDLGTDGIIEYDLGPDYISPYYARPDGKGKIWISSTGSDRLLRLDPATGEVVFYLMPVPYDARKVVVDTSAAVTTVWLPNKNRSELIRVEVADD